MTRHRRPHWHYLSEHALRALLTVCVAYWTVRSRIFPKRRTSPEVKP